MAKKTQQKSRRNNPIMGRSDIPYSKRLALRQSNDIIINRDNAARIAMYCMSVAVHRLEGVGYKRLVRFSRRFREVVDEFYDDPEVGMAHAKRRMEQLGMPISGEFYSIQLEGQTKRTQELYNHALQAAQIAFVCGTIAMNEEFGYGEIRQKRISDLVSELTKRYTREGEQFLLDEMEKIGFPIVDGKVMAYTDEDGNAVTPSKARKEGYNDQ